MYPGHLAVLQHGRNQRGARRVHHALGAGITQYLAMGLQQRLFQKQGRLFQHGLGLLLKKRGNHLQCYLCGHFAVRMPAHAVRQHEQCRLSRVAVAHAVFVEGTASAAAELEDGKFHGLRLLSVTAPRSEPPSF